MIYGKHTIKTWSQTQAIVTLSTGEAEYYGLVRGGSIALGIRNMIEELGVSLGIVLKTDASAALGIANRRGSGKIRHIEVHQLWLQEKVALGEIQVEKILGTKNPADALTKYVTGNQLREHDKRVNLEHLKGRHTEALTIKEL